MKRKFLILLCLILFIVSVAGVSATEDANQTIDDDANNVVSTEDTLSVSLSDDEIMGSAGEGSFTELQKKIDQASNESTIYLEKNYAFDDTIDSNHITIDKPITINGNGFTIDGKHVKKAFSIESSAKNVVLNNIIFTNTFDWGNGGAVESWGNNLTVSGCSFINSSTDFYGGGAIFVEGNLSVSDCNFMNNIAGTHEGPISGIGYFGGGAIFVTGYIFASDCYFTNNYGKVGGGNDIYVEDGVSDIVGCNFMNNNYGETSLIFVNGNMSIGGSNFANCSGGAISNVGDLTVDGCSFENCSGVAISGSNSVVGCSFVNCSGVAISGDGSIVGCSFVNGGIAISIQGDLTVGGCIFINNTASRFLAIIHSEGENAYIFNSTFINNFPLDYNPDHVRAEKIIKSSHIIIDREVFFPSEDIQINIKLDDGATGKVIVNINGMEETLTLTDSSASLVKPNLGLGTYDMSVRYLGDESFSPSEKSTTLKIVKATFKDLQKLIDNLDDGGVINLDKDYTYSESQDDSLFIQNRKNIRINGNGHTLDGKNKKSIFNIEDSNVILENINFVNANGQAIYSQRSNLNVTKCGFVNNSVLWIDDVISSSGSGDLTVVDCSFVNNSAENGQIIRPSGSGDLTVVDCSFVNNTVGWAGAVIGAKDNLTVVGCSFINTYGGETITILHDLDESYDNYNIVSNCSFVNCAGIRTDYDYSAIVVNGNLTVVGCSFVNNTAGYGAAIQSNGILDVVGCSFVNNHVTHNGGAISSIGFYNGDVIFCYGFLSVVDCSFVNNSGGYGGAIECRGNSTVSGSVFINNSGSDGGAITNYDGSLSVVDCSFVNNYASYYCGGAIDAAGNLSVVGCSFEDNYLRDECYGTAIYFFNSLDIINNTFIKKGVYKRVYNKVSKDILADKNIVLCGSDYTPLICTLIEKGGDSINLSAPDITKYYCGSKEFVVSLSGDYGPIDTFDVNININGVDYSLKTNSEGIASLPVDLDCGVYNAVVSCADISKTATITIIPVPSETALSINKVSYNSVDLTADLYPRNIYGDVVFTVNGENYTAYASDSKATYALDNLANGFYEVKATYVGDTNHASSSDMGSFIVGNDNFNIYAPDVTKYYNGPEKFVVTLTDGNIPLTNQSISIMIDGQTYTRTTDKNGQASIDLGLDSGKYDVKTTYRGSTVKSTVVINPAPTKTVLSGVKNINVGDSLTVTATVNATAGSVTFKVGSNTQKVDIVNNKASYTIADLSEGSYEISASYNDVGGNYLSSSDSASFSVSKISPKLSVIADDIGEGQDAIFEITANEDCTGDINVLIDGKNYKNTLSNGKTIIKVPNLTTGDYNYTVSFLGDEKYGSKSIDGAINVKSINVILNAPDLVKYYGSKDKLSAQLLDKSNKPLSGQKIIFTVNGRDYERITDNSGIASMNINLISGNHIANVRFEGNGTYDAIKTTVEIQIKPTVSGKDVTKIYKNGTQYYATFVDTDGNLLKNTDVEFNINGVFYTRKTNDYGVARMNINLNPGEYIITAKNPNSGEQYTNLIKVLPSIVEVHDLTKYYKNASKLTFKLLDDQGRPVGAGVSATININGVLYTRETNASGYVSMNINLPAGTYIATLSYNGLMASSTVKILPILSAKDIKMKYKDGTKFEAKLLDGQGKAFPNQKVTFNINGVFYPKTTDDNGIARLAINLPAGEYIITSMYENGATISNKVTISG